MVFGKLFGKKEEEKKSSMDLTLWDLEEGYFVDYFLKSWQVTEEYEYDWGNNFFSKEFTLDSGDEILFLHVSDEGSELECSISKEIKIRSIEPDPKEHILEYDEPPKTMKKDGKVYYRDAEEAAECRKLGEDNWHQVVQWEYEDEDEEEFLSLSRWSESDVEAFHGKYVEPYEFSNIIPAQNDEKKKK